MKETITIEVPDKLSKRLEVSLRILLLVAKWVSPDPALKNEIEKIDTRLYLMS
jgi:hypothetical protein